MVEAGAAGVVPRPVPKEKPPVLAAGALRRKNSKFTQYSKVDLLFFSLKFL